MVIVIIVGFLQRSGETCAGGWRNHSYFIISVGSVLVFSEICAGGPCSKQLFICSVKFLCFLISNFGTNSVQEDSLDYPASRSPKPQGAALAQLSMVKVSLPNPKELLREWVSSLEPDRLTSTPRSHIRLSQH